MHPVLVSADRRKVVHHQENFTPRSVFRHPKMWVPRSCQADVESLDCGDRTRRTASSTPSKVTEPDNRTHQTPKCHNSITDGQRRGRGPGRHQRLAVPGTRPFGARSAGWFRAFRASGARSGSGATTTTPEPPWRTGGRTPCAGPVNPAHQSWDPGNAVPPCPEARLVAPHCGAARLPADTANTSARPGPRS
jgi:hypothetical protein